MVPGAWREDFDVGMESFRKRSSTLPAPLASGYKHAPPPPASKAPLHLDHVVDFQHRLSQSLQSNTAEKTKDGIHKPFTVRPKESMLEASDSGTGSPFQSDGSDLTKFTMQDSSRVSANTSAITAYSPPASPIRHIYKKQNDSSPLRSSRLSTHGSPASRVRSATSISTLNSSPFFSGHGGFSNGSPSVTTTSHPSLSAGNLSASSFTSSPMTNSNSPVMMSPIVFSSPTTSRGHGRGTDHTEVSGSRRRELLYQDSPSRLSVSSDRPRLASGPPSPLVPRDLNLSNASQTTRTRIAYSKTTPSPSPRRPRPSGDSFLHTDYFNQNASRSRTRQQSFNIEAEASAFSNRMLTTLSLPGSPDLSTSMDITPLSIDSRFLSAIPNSEAVTPDLPGTPWTLSMEGSPEPSLALSLPASVSLSPSPSLRVRLGLDKDDQGHVVVFPSPSISSPNPASPAMISQPSTLRMAMERDLEVGDTTRAFLDSSVAEYAAAYLSSAFDESDEEILPLGGVIARDREATPQSPVVSSVQAGVASPSAAEAQHQFLRAPTPEADSPSLFSKVKQLGSRMRKMLHKDKGSSRKLDVLMTQTIRRRSYHSPGRQVNAYLSPRRAPSPPERQTSNGSRRSGASNASHTLCTPIPAGTPGNSAPLVTPLPATPPPIVQPPHARTSTPPPASTPLAIQAPVRSRRRFSIPMLSLSSQAIQRTPPSPVAIQHRQARPAPVAGSLRIAAGRRPHSMALILRAAGDSPQAASGLSSPRRTRALFNTGIRNSSSREMDQFMPEVPIEDIVRRMDENAESGDESARLLSPPGLEDYNRGRANTWMRRGGRRRNSVPIF